MPMPVISLAIPAAPAAGLAGSHTSGAAFRTLTWYGARPDWMAERVGEQYLKT